MLSHVQFHNQLRWRPKCLSRVMIEVTRMNQVALLLNADLIEYVEVVPDTVITLTTGQKLMVRESAREITEKIIAFRREIFRDLFSLSPELLHRLAARSS